MPPKKTETKAKAVATTDSILGASAPDPSSAGAADFEKLGVFYLGRPYDLAAKKAKPGWLLVVFSAHHLDGKSNKDQTQQ